MRTLAIGDIHGFCEVLNLLLDSLDLVQTRLIFLGDYIDRGPQSRQVLDTLIELSSNPNHVFLCGNHDQWMMNARTEEGWFGSWLNAGVGGKATLESYGATEFTLEALDLVPNAHWNVLQHTRLFYEDDFHIYVHASATWEALEETDSRVLLWGSIYGIPPQQNGKRVICGHTSIASGTPLNLGHVVGIDTFCSGKGWLSAFDVETDEVFQANAEGQTRQISLGAPMT